MRVGEVGEVGGEDVRVLSRVGTGPEFHCCGGLGTEYIVSGCCCWGESRRRFDKDLDLKVQGGIDCSREGGQAGRQAACEERRGGEASQV